VGLGDCLQACKHDAIHIIRGLATVDDDKCIGGNACMRACPRNIIAMAPFKSDRMLVVACSNQDSGPDVKARCKAGCLGCKLCTRNNNVIEMDGNLPRINYDKYDPQVNFEPIRGIGVLLDDHGRPCWPDHRFRGLAAARIGST
jgi:Na+-translocating ferredoxin:NAD+ oxidoreductase subunit B